MKASSKQPRKKSSGKAKTCPRYPLERKLGAVKLHLEEEYSLNVLSEELGPCKDTVFKWVQYYLMGGAEALKPKARSGGQKKRLPQAVTDRTVETKKKHPTFGIKRISDVLKRWFCLSASPETVRNRLHEEGLMDPPTKRKPKRNMTRPRFFERATPNQLWQKVCRLSEPSHGQINIGGRWRWRVQYRWSRRG